MLTERGKKSILLLQIITQLYYSVSQSQEMKQSRSLPRHYTAFFHLSGHKTIKLNTNRCFATSIKLEEHNYW